jgi:mono/diheme cytochrome c family protein
MKIPPSRPAVFFMVALLAACDPAPGDVREWTADDHEQPAAAQNNAAAPRPKGSGRAPAGSGELDLVELAWERNCTPCHGQRGRGDGPQGPMLRAPDLTRVEWHEKVSDQEILEVIRKGRNKMPAFDLPPQVLKGLVQRIRTMRQH